MPIFYKHKCVRNRFSKGRETDPLPESGKYWLHLCYESSEHIGGTDAVDGDGRTDGPSILFPIAASFLAAAAAALSLTFITSILAIARKGREGERERERGKQNTFCQIDVDHLSYLSAMAEGARQR